MRSNLPRVACLIFIVTLLAGVVSTSVVMQVQALSRYSALTLNKGENRLHSAVIDPSGSYAYFGTGDYPGIVVKVRLSDMSRVGVLTLNSGEDDLVSAVIDPSGSYAYFGTHTSPGRVVKVRLLDMSCVDILTLNSGEDYLDLAVIDPAGSYAYFGTNPNPNKVVKVRLSNFTRVGALTLNTEEFCLRSAVIDPSGSYAYFGTVTFPGIVVKVSLDERAPPTPSPTPPPSPDFSITSSPLSQTANNGSSTTYTLIVSSLNSFNSQVALSVSSWPTGLFGTFNPTSITPVAGGSIQSTLIVNVASTAGAGSYPIAIVGTSSNQTHSIMTTLTVIVATPPSPTTTPTTTTTSTTTPPQTTTTSTTTTSTFTPSATPTPTTTPPPRQGCLIATALYGSPLEPEVQFLRHFRDETLVKVAGQTYRNSLNDWYYSFSPQVSEFIRQNQWMRPPIILLISPTVSFLHAVDVMIQLIAH